MTAYFNKTNAMNTDNLNIIKTFYAADSQPQRFFRIALDKGIMLLDYKGQKEHVIQQADIFVWTSFNELTQLHFSPEEPAGYFYAALAENSGIGIKTIDSDSVLEVYHEFLSEDPSSEQGLFGMFETDCGTILITYQSSAKDIGFSFIPETPESTSAADQMRMFFKYLLPGNMEDETDYGSAEDDE